MSTNGSVHLVTSEVEIANNSNKFAARTIDAMSGQPNGETLRLGSGLGGNHWNDMRHVSTSAGFLAATYHYTGGFAAHGAGWWIAISLDSKGEPSKDIKNAVTPVVVDTAQRTPPGYRTYGLRHLALDIAWDGRRALFVCEQHRHGAGRRALSDAYTPGNIDILAIFVNQHGRRLLDPAEEAAVEPDRFATKGPSLVLMNGEQVAPLRIASGPATQSVPAVVAGQEGVFLVVWQEESPGSDSQIMGRLVSVK